MATIILDFENIYTGQGTVIASTDDYVSAYVTLHTAIHNNDKITLVIRNHNCAQWLRRAALKYGQSKIVIHDYNVRKAIEENWGVEVPLRSMTMI